MCGPDLFSASDMMLEGLVSKRRDSRYRPGPSRDRIKVKNPKSPAMNSNNSKPCTMSNVPATTTVSDLAGTGHAIPFYGAV
jgi:hypothetical protein